MRTLESTFRNEYGNDITVKVIATEDCVRTFMKGPNSDTELEMTPVETIEIARLWNAAALGVAPCLATISERENA